MHEETNLHLCLQYSTLQEQEPNLAAEQPAFWTESCDFPSKNQNTANTIQFLPPIQTDTLTFVLPVFAFCTPHNILNTKKTTVDVVKPITHGFPSFEIEGVKTHLQEEVSIVHYQF